jgi:predicted fused transcriptional regulator/phosphomethylpyrimidine kinase
VDISRNLSFDTPYLEPDVNSPKLDSQDEFALSSANFSPSSTKNRGAMSLLKLSLDGLNETETMNDKMPFRLTTIMSEGNLAVLDQTDEKNHQELKDQEAVVAAFAQEFGGSVKSTSSSVFEELNKLDDTDRESVFSQYKAEFGTKSHTNRVIDAINKKAKMAKIREEFIEREAVFAQYKAEFGVKSATLRVIEEQDKQDAAEREAVFARYKAEFGTKSATLCVIEEHHKQDAAEREAVFAQYKAEFGTKSHTNRVIDAINR